MIREHLTDASIASAANKVTATGGATAVVFGWTANEAAAIAGAVAAVGGFVVSIFFKVRERMDARAEARFRREMEQRREERERELHDLNKLRITARHQAVCEGDAP